MDNFSFPLDEFGEPIDDVDVLMEIIATEEHARHSQHYLPYSPPPSDDASSPHSNHNPSPPYEASIKNEGSDYVTDMVSCMTSRSLVVNAQAPTMAPPLSNTRTTLNPVYSTPNGVERVERTGFKKRKHSTTSLTDIINESVPFNSSDNVFSEIEQLVLNDIDAQFANIPYLKDEIPSPPVAMQRDDDVISQSGDDSSQLHWQPHPLEQECCLCDEQMNELPRPRLHISTDKGFANSPADAAYVNHRKNHFQVSFSVEFTAPPAFVTSPAGFWPVDNFSVHIYGVKTDSLHQRVLVEQSQSDRRRKPYQPLLLRPSPENPTSIKSTVTRLHFSETTHNNQRKRGLPNPDQKYFRLVVEIFAVCARTELPLVSAITEKFIVRASNPKQFESESHVEPGWQEGSTATSLCHKGRVGINTFAPDEALSVHGNIKVTGHVLQPSDVRLKCNITEVNYGEQLKNVSALRLHQYNYQQCYARTVGMSDEDRIEIGVLAQEVREYLPEAVTNVGDLPLGNGDVVENLLVVNKDRIYLESVGAVKELCKLTGNIESRVCELEHRDRKLTRFARTLPGYGSQSSASSKSSRTSKISAEFCFRSRTVETRGFPSDVPLVDQRRSYSEYKKKQETLCKRAIIGLIILVFALAIISIASITAAVLFSERSKQDTDAKSQIIVDGVVFLPSDGGVTVKPTVTSGVIANISHLQDAPTVTLLVNCSMMACRAGGCCGTVTPLTVLPNPTSQSAKDSTTAAVKYPDKVGSVQNSALEQISPNTATTGTSADPKAKAVVDPLPMANTDVVASKTIYKMRRKRSEGVVELDLSNCLAQPTNAGQYICPATGLSTTDLLTITARSSCKVADMTCTCQCKGTPALSTGPDQCASSAELLVTVTNEDITCIN